MAELAGAFGVPHTPLLWRLMAEEPPPDLRVVADEFARFRALIEEAGPDVIVFVASDHFHQYSHRNMATFAVGKADVIAGTYPNEEASFGLPRIQVPGHPGIARAILGRETLGGRFDFAFSDEPRLDHAYVVPLLYLVPDLSIPVVPIHTNTNAPPLPTARRFTELGVYLREAIEAWPSSERVLVLGTGHLAYELGGPRQFSGESTDPDFDRSAVGWIRDGALTEAVEGCTFDRLLAAGNLSFQFLNFLTLAALSGTRATTAEGVGCRFGNEPFFSWDTP
ncbi:MAG: extradiol ring-cleavage dioxygenase [Acidimicrobiia bacterium]|nr:extradiol ring-cleavage dioxygenase [Acidimicrobiia bacterium]MDH4307744.1 extradiol ring-cleavage dioxygenase [Acidimicrobiia bacterium]MDH5293185.1 extradiol ring-cleavage dioxygenase [Acidimicrobiia bacterium]